MSQRGELPKWVDVGLIPLINLVIALFISGLVVVIIGENPFRALAIMIDGALGSLKGWSYMFYYATTSFSPGWQFLWRFMRACSTSVVRAKPIQQGLALQRRGFCWAAL